MIIMIQLLIRYKTNCSVPHTRSSRLIPLVRKLWNFYLPRIDIKNHTLQGIVQHRKLCNIPREPHRQSSIMPSRREKTTTFPSDIGSQSEGKVVIFCWLESTYWGKRMNFPPDIGSKKGFLTGITESIPTFEHTGICNKTPCLRSKTT
jgi:hypothetical protein